MPHERLTDQFCRKITHLRLSLTDRCNFRCIYCMPPEGIDCLPKQNFLSASEIKRLVSIFCRLGINKVRLTGGEPLLRSEVLVIADKISSLPGVCDLALTTNGSQLKRLAKPLKECGVQRLNISLDSLNEATFKKMSLTHSFNDVMDGILESLHVGLPVKINAVIMKGLNDCEIPDFIEFALNNPIQEVRFIEFMPLCGTGWKPEYVLPLDSWMEYVQKYYQGRAVFQGEDSVSKSFEIKSNGRSGRIGFITTMSNPFCNHCSRIRITADGMLRPCLFSNEGRSLKELLKNGARDHEIISAIQETVWRKPEGNKMALFNKENKYPGYFLRQGRTAASENPFIRSIGG